MIVYRDIISGDEMLSDAFPLKQVVDKEGNEVNLFNLLFFPVCYQFVSFQVAGLMYCTSKMITVGNDDVDVGCGNAFGGDAEEEGGAGGTEEKVNNIINGFQYTETQIGTVNDFKSWLKEYMNLIVAKMKEGNKGKEAIQAFKGTAAGIAKFLVSNFSDLQFYLGASFDANTMVFSMYEDGELTPNFYFIMGGFAAEKF